MASRGVNFKATSNIDFKGFDTVHIGEPPTWSSEQLGMEEHQYSPRAKNHPPIPPADLDDYDPRKPEYIMPIAAHEAKAKQAELVRQQMACLQSVLSRRKEDESPGVMKHYKNVLQDMAGAVNVPPKSSLVSPSIRREYKDSSIETVTTSTTSTSVAHEGPRTPRTSSFATSGIAESTTIAPPRKSGAVRLPSSKDNCRESARGIASIRSPSHIGLRGQHVVSHRSGQPGTAPTPRTFRNLSPAKLKHTNTIDVVRVGATGAHQSLRCIPQRAPPQTNSARNNGITIRGAMKTEARI